MNNIKILHICNDFLGSKVHFNLYRQMDSLEVIQKIFVPLRKSKLKGSNKINFKVKDSEIIYSSLLKRYHRLLFRWKIRLLNSDIKRAVNMTDIDVIHATTLFSDGAIALKLHNKYNKPFIVTVRNTDVFTFLKFRPDLAYLAHKILAKASKIVFVSEANKLSFFDHKLITMKKHLYDEKVVVINNGIDDYWHVNDFRNISKQTYSKILYVGKFERNKNVVNLIKALVDLKMEIPEVELGLVGGGGEQENEILSLIKDRDWIHYYGAVLDKPSLMEIYRKHDLFCMISYHETFGLVYIEALTQGLPVLYTKGQGIDGVFDIRVGEGVHPDSLEDIKSGLKRLILDPPSNELNKIDISRFNWSKVAEKYLAIYNLLMV